jgi:hypothetical protein
MPEGAEWLVLDGAQLPGVRYVTLAGTGPLRERGGARVCRAGGADGCLVELPEAPPLSARVLDPAPSWAEVNRTVTATATVNGGVQLENDGSVW